MVELLFADRPVANYDSFSDGEKREKGCEVCVYFVYVYFLFVTDREKIGQKSGEHMCIVCIFLVFGEKKE